MLKIFLCLNAERWKNYQSLANTQTAMLVKAPWHSPHFCFCAWLLLLQHGIPLSTSDTTGAAAAEAKGWVQCSICNGAYGHDAEQLFQGSTQLRAQTRGPLLTSKQRASLQLRGGQGQQHNPGMPPGIFGLNKEEPADSDEMWESFRSFASSKGMPTPPKDPAALPHIRCTRYSNACMNACTHSTQLQQCQCLIAQETHA